MMRRLIVCLYVFIVAVLPICAKPARADMSQSPVTSPKILIISSYQVETDWSKYIIDGVFKQLNDIYPDAQVRVGYMNLNTQYLPAGPLFTLRSISWSFVDSDTKSVDAEDGHVKTMFATGQLPDVLLFIGADAFLFYQNYGPWLGQWRNIPIVVCGIPDSVAKDGWQLEKSIDFETLIPVEDLRSIEYFVDSKSRELLDDALKFKKHVQGNVQGYLTDINYNITGIKTTYPIRENLELMHHLIPTLTEVSWLGNDYYTSSYIQWLLNKEMPAILPEVKLTYINQNRFNTDSIYNEILKPVSNKAYLTYLWDMDGKYSRQTEEQIKTLFTNYSNVPLFSLTRRSLSNPFWIGGYYQPYSAYIDKTVGMVNRILQGEPANHIPFETVDSGKVILDQPLLKKYGLLDAARSLADVEYVNVPPTYYEENEGVILVNIIVGAILLGLLIYWINRIRYTRSIHKEFLRYKKLYDKLHLIYGHTSIDLALYDVKGRLLFSIIKGRELSFGKEKDGLFSDNLFENPHLNRRLKEQIEQGQPINSEVTVITDGPLSSVDSERKIYQLMVKPLNEDNLRSAKYVAIAVNINQIIREREERERFENLVRFASDSSQVGIAFYDVITAEGTGTNSWYSNLNEPLAPGLLPTYKCVVPEDRRLLLDYREKVMQGVELPPFNQNIRVVDEQGQEHWITQHIFVNEIDRNMLIELNLNVDEQKASENDLLKAKNKVERSIVETQEFLANINHEIRTPLNSIVGFSAILAASESEEERKEHVSIILKNNQLLTMLIDDVIALSKIDSGQANFGKSPVKVEELFKKVMDAGYSELYNKQLDIIMDIDEDHPVAYTDSDAVYRLLNNLVSNAIKFTQAGSVTLGYRKESTRYYFYVKDTGQGIAPEDQRRIFKRFFKLDSYMQGTGLGLALCKTIVENLGGEMGVESESGKGSTFWFALPL